jgi:hypothetical protein
MGGGWRRGLLCVGAVEGILRTATPHPVSLRLSPAEHVNVGRPPWCRFWFTALCDDRGIAKGAVPVALSAPITGRRPRSGKKPRPLRAVILSEAKDTTGFREVASFPGQHARGRRHVSGSAGAWSRLEAAA